MNSSSSVDQQSQSQLDHRALRHVFGTFATGVTIVTTLTNEGVPLGITVNSFASVSLDPPLVLWSQARSSPSHAAFLEAKAMSIHILAEDQADLSTRFSRPNDDRFEGIAFSRGATGAPKLGGCTATLDCTVINHYDGGDHTIFLCQVQSHDIQEKEPLIFLKGAYQTSKKS